MTDLRCVYDPTTGPFSNPSSDSPLIISEAVGNAMWTYKFVVCDNRMGVNSSKFTKALLVSTLEAIK